MLTVVQLFNFLLLIIILIQYYIISKRKGTFRCPYNLNYLHFITCVINESKTTLYPSCRYHVVNKQRAISIALFICTELRGNRRLAYHVTSVVKCARYNNKFKHFCLPLRFGQALASPSEISIAKDSPNGKPSKQNNSDIFVICVTVYKPPRHILNLINSFPIIFCQFIIISHRMNSHRRY